MQCLACDDPNPQKEEDNDPTRRFCNKQCQQNFYCIGLKDDGVKSGLEPIDDDDMVGLQSSDGKYFRLSRSNAMKMRTIVDLVKDSGTDDYIPISRVTGDVLEVIVKYVSLSEEEAAKTTYFSQISENKNERYIVRVAEAISYLNVAYMLYLQGIFDIIAYQDPQYLFKNFKPYILMIYAYARPTQKKRINQI